MSEAGALLNLTAPVYCGIYKEVVIEGRQSYGRKVFKQVTGDAAYSVATEFVEFTVGTLDVGGGAQASGF